MNAEEHLWHAEPDSINPNITFRRLRPFTPQDVLTAEGPLLSAMVAVAVMGSVDAGYMLGKIVSHTSDGKHWEDHPDYASGAGLDQALMRMVARRFAVLVAPDEAKDVLKCQVMNPKGQSVGGSTSDPALVTVKLLRCCVLASMMLENPL